MLCHTPTPAQDPHAEYTRRRDARRADAERHARLDRNIANARIGVFLIGAVVAGLALTRAGVSPLWILLPAAVFVGLVIYHERVLEEGRRARRAAAFYEDGLARLEDRWPGTGRSGERFLDPEHPYARDLDLFGRGSLFELLCTARTHAGEETLAGWLLAPASPETVRARQAAVEDLRPRLDFREDLALLGEEVRAAVDMQALVAWGSAPPVLFRPWERIAARVLVALTLAAALAWALGYGPLPFYGLLLIEQVFAVMLLGRVRQVVQAVEGPARHLALFAPLLARLEAERFEAPLLGEWRAALEVHGEPPSARLAQLQRLIALLDTQRNILFLPVAIVLLWAVHLSFAIEEWRAESGAQVGRWIEVAGEMEALAALAAFAYEHPADPFPEVLDAGRCFEAEEIGHPLLSERRAVRNSLRLGEDLRLLIISGSNMSGKSTLLRTVGTNTVLALAGAPVRARRLRLAPAALGASITVQDSLQGGTSRFYAEITRLRQIMDLASGPLPLLFLLDEILGGTNSHDRRIGAEAVLRALVERGGIGLVTTHDLALTRIAEDRGLPGVNAHFEDHMEEGKISFDYHLRPGVVQKSNALALMRAVGLEV